jgi:hypothetical protein
MASNLCRNNPGHARWRHTAPALAIGLSILTGHVCAVTTLSDEASALAERVLPLEVTPRWSGPPYAAAAAVAAIDLPSGTRVTFFDLGNAEVGIGERTTRRAAAVALELTRKFNATPLEIYLALRHPSSPIPELLLRNHALRTGGSAAPRTLRAPGGVVAGGPGGPGAPGTQDYPCDPFGFWINDWKSSFEGVTKYREALYLHQQQASFTFYPGALVFSGQGGNRVTYLGACNGDLVNLLRLKVDQRINGQWQTIHIEEIAGATKYTFHSLVPGSFRGTTEPVNQLVEHSGVGAAWSVALPKASP